MAMKKQNIVVFVVLALMVFLGVYGVLQLTSESGSTERAEKRLEKMVKKIDATERELVKGTVDLSGSTTLAEELPEIDKYPMSLQGNGQINIEVFAAPEKAGEGTDGWMLEAAEKFNNEGYTISGQTVSVSIRSMSSGTGADYIASGKYVPQVFSPSNELWGELITAQGTTMELVEKKVIGNVAGILVSQKVKKEIESKYNELTFETVVEATTSGEVAMGYTNPFYSSTGLNFLLETLYLNDQNNILSDTAIEGFASFQKNVPFVSYTTQQMRDAADSGALDGMVTEYQTYINDKNLSNYEFIPFGARHDGPIYAVGDLTAEQREAVSLFVDYCMSDDMQKLAKKYGFNQYEDYTSQIPDFDGATIMEAQNLWKENKDSGSSITAVFVADTSGSMDGEPINQLKESLINAGQYIESDNSIGLVSFNTDVFIDIPIAPFDLNQRSYFNGAVENLVCLGGTATYNGITVGTNMLVEAKKANPNTKLVLFLLSDGEKNQGYDLSDVDDILKEYQIPVYSIAYGDGANMDELNAVSSVNEATVIDADSDDVIYKLKNLFNAQM